MSAFLVMMVLPLLLALAAGWDLASYTIPNLLPVGIAAAFLIFAVLSGLPGAAWGAHLAAGAVALVAGFAFFAAGWIGGGDGQIFGAAALWVGFGGLLSYALVGALLLSLRPVGSAAAMPNYLPLPRCGSVSAIYCPTLWLPRFWAVFLPSRCSWRAVYRSLPRSSARVGLRVCTINGPAFLMVLRSPPAPWWCCRQRRFCAR
jgi:hypothetical protein